MHGAFCSTASVRAGKAVTVPLSVISFIILPDNLEIDHGVLMSLSASWSSDLDQF